MKNLPIILNVILFALVGHLYYLNSKCVAGGATTSNMPSTAQGHGVRIAYVNSDTLNDHYEWLKEQKAVIEQRMAAAEKTLSNKEEALAKTS